MSWENLKLKEKAGYIKTAVKNGITDIEDIKREYNKFDEGGDTQSKNWYGSHNLSNVEDPPALLHNTGEYLAEPITNTWNGIIQGAKDTYHAANTPYENPSFYYNPDDFSDISYLNPQVSPLGANVTVKMENGQEFTGTPFKRMGKTYITPDGTFDNAVEYQDPNNVTYLRPYESTNKGAGREVLSGINTAARIAFALPSMGFDYADKVVNIPFDLVGEGLNAMGIENDISSFHPVNKAMSMTNLANWYGTFNQGVAPWSADNKGFGDEDLNETMGLLSMPFMTKAGKKIIKNINTVKGRGTGNIQFIRTAAGLPIQTEEGKVLLSPKGQALTNLTYDQGVIRHRSWGKRGYKNSLYYTVDPKAFEGKAPLSTNAMDVIFENTPIDKKYVTVFTGNAEEAAAAKAAGYKVVTNENLQSIYNNSAYANIDIGDDNFILEKDPTIPDDYAKAINTAIRNEYGEVTMDDVREFERNANIKSDSKNNNFINRLFHRRNPNIRTTSDFANILYNEATPIEANLAKRFGFEQHPEAGTLNYQSIVDAIGSRPLQFTPSRTLSSEGVKLLKDLATNNYITRRSKRLYHQLERRTPIRILERSNEIQEHFSSSSRSIVALTIPLSKERIGLPEDTDMSKLEVASSHINSSEAPKASGGTYVNPFTGLTYKYEGKTPEVTSKRSISQPYGNLIVRDNEDAAALNYSRIIPTITVTENGIPVLKDYRGNTEALQEGTAAYLQDLEKSLGMKIHPSGSTVLAREGLLDDIPGDIELFLTEEEAKQVADKLGVDYNPSYGGKYMDVYKMTFNHKYGAGKKNSFDLDIIQNSDNGKAIGRSAHQIYAMLHPEKYAQMLKERSQPVIESEGYKSMSKKDALVLNSLETQDSRATFDWELPVSAEELLSEYDKGNNAVKMQVINALSSSNPKHMERVNQMMAIPEYSQPFREALVTKAKSYLPDYKTVEQLYPDIDFNDVESNKRLLEKLQIDPSFATNEEFMHTLAEKLNFDMIHGRNVDAKRTSKANYGDKLKDGSIWNISQNLFTSASSQFISGGGSNNVRGSSGGPRFGNLQIVRQKGFKPNDIHTPEDLFTKINSLDKGSKIASNNITKINQVLEKYGMAPLSEGSTMKDLDSAILSNGDIEARNKIAREIANDTDLIGYVNNDSYTNVGGYLGTYYENADAYNTAIHSWGSDNMELGAGNTADRILKAQKEAAVTSYNSNLSIDGKDIFLRGIPLSEFTPEDINNATSDTNNMYTRYSKERFLETLTPEKKKELLRQYKKETGNSRTDVLQNYSAFASWVYDRASTKDRLTYENNQNEAIKRNLINFVKDNAINNSQTNLFNKADIPYEKYHALRKKAKALESPISTALASGYPQALGTVAGLGLATAAVAIGIQDMSNTYQLASVKSDLEEAYSASDKDKKEILDVYGINNDELNLFHDKIFTTSFVNYLTTMRNADRNISVKDALLLYHSENPKDPSYQNYMKKFKKGS